MSEEIILGRSRRSIASEQNAIRRSNASALAAIGEKHNSLEVIGVGYLSVNGAGQRVRFVECRCECGEIIHWELNKVRFDGKKSCGCKRAADELLKTDEHGVWKGMKERCDEKKKDNYPRHAGRGIKVCARWTSDFKNFLSDMGSRPSKNHEIDRIDNDGGYWCGKPECPECGPLRREPNCRWAMRDVQANNRSNNVMVSVDGEEMTQAQACAKYSLPVGVFRYRIAQGVGVIEALTTPTKKPGRPKMFEIDGEMMLLKDAAARYGIQYQVISNRMSKGWSAEDAVKTPLGMKRGSR